MALGLPLFVLAPTLVPWLAGPPPSVAGFEDCGLQPPTQAAVAPVAPKPGQQPAEGLLPPFVRPAPSATTIGVPGILAGKTVYVSAGHGLVDTAFGWRAQRGNTNGIVEDLVSIEAVNQYLVPYLHSMGAYVVPVRESDLGVDVVIIDDPDAILEGAPTEGSAAGRGWAEVSLPIASDSVAPFDAGDARSLQTSAASTGALVYDADVARDGHYNVYISFVQGADRAPDAHWVVRHSGGESHFRIDQRRHGSTWVLLGRFHFEAGADATASAVALFDDSAQAGTIVSADAVRIGGGMALHDRGRGPNDRPLAEQCARYYTQWNGAPPSVFDPSNTDQQDDVSSRPRFAAWEHEPGEDAVYVAWHTNAPDPGRGTSSYTYSSSAPNGTLDQFSGVAGSRELQDALHAEILDDLRAEIDPEWNDRGRHTAFFGEVNPSNNPEMPAVLLEIAFHDTPADAAELREPGFRRVVARAIAQGIATYFAEADGIPLVLPPEPPSALAVVNDGDGGLLVQWSAPDDTAAGGDPPSSYLVQVSPNGYGFDEGTMSTETSLTLDGLEPGDVRYVRVLAVNDGGRSLPSSAVGASVAPSGQASVLVIDGFDRLDGGQLLQDDLSIFDLATVDRMRLPQMNDFAYLPRHGAAIDGAGFSFDAATDDWVDAGAIETDDYQAVDWFTGRDSVGDEPLSALSRDTLTDYADGGGHMLVSGTELGWTLDEFGTPDEKAFFNERLHASYVADDATVTGIDVSEGPFAELADFSFDDPTAYEPRFPDVLAPEASGTLALRYTDGFDSGAAITWDDNDARGVLLGFPFETIDDAQTRVEVMAAVLATFGVVEAEGEGGDDGDGDDGDDDGGTAADETAGGDGSLDDAAVDGDSDGTQGSDTEGTGAASDGDDGCGCRQRTGSGPTAALLLLGLIALPRRRR